MGPVFGIRGGAGLRALAIRSARLVGGVPHLRRVARPGAVATHHQEPGILQHLADHGSALARVSVRGHRNCHPRRAARDRAGNRRRGAGVVNRAYLGGLAHRTAGGSHGEAGWLIRVHWRAPGGGISRARSWVAAGLLFDAGISGNHRTIRRYPRTGGNCKHPCITVLCWPFLGVGDQRNRIEKADKSLIINSGGFGIETVQAANIVTRISARGSGGITRTPSSKVPGC